MKIQEEELEQIIYESPWLLNDSYVIPQIAGSSGEFGRQVNIGRNNNRYIDLLFKDTSVMLVKN